MYSIFSSFDVFLDNASRFIGIDQKESEKTLFLTLDSDQEGDGSSRMGGELDDN